jgi:shikimate kinase
MDSAGNKIYLIGFMGSGKSTLGKRLASQLGWTFTDLDKLIEERTGLKIPMIFEKRGEKFFREVESEALRSLAGINRLVISTGGGTPCSGNNMEYMNETGLTVYLKMDPEQLYRRLSTSSVERPLLKGLDRNELLDFIIRKLGEREKWYSRAALTTKSQRSDFSELLSQVKNWIQR